MARVAKLGRDKKKSFVNQTRGTPHFFRNNAADHRVRDHEFKLIINSARSSHPLKNTDRFQIKHGLRSTHTLNICISDAALVLCFGLRWSISIVIGLKNEPFGPAYINQLRIHHSTASICN